MAKKTKDKLGHEILRLAWLKKNLKHVKMAEEVETNHYFCYDSPSGTYIAADTIMGVVDAALEEEEWA